MSGHLDSQSSHSSVMAPSASGQALLPGDTGETGLQVPAPPFLLGAHIGLGQKAADRVLPPAE